MDSGTPEIYAWLYVVLWSVIIAAIVVFASVEVYRYRKRQIAKLKEAGRLPGDDPDD